MYILLSYFKDSPDLLVCLCPCLFYHNNLHANNYAEVLRLRAQVQSSWGWGCMHYLSRSFRISPSFVLVELQTNHHISPSFVHSLYLAGLLINQSHFARRSCIAILQSCRPIILSLVSLQSNCQYYILGKMAQEQSLPQPATPRRMQVGLTLSTDVIAT